jgi:Kef-type K+ transport system membrane component KefB
VPNPHRFAIRAGRNQVGEFAFVLLSRASNLGLVQRKLYLLLLGTTALSIVTTPLLFRSIPYLIRLFTLMRWLPREDDDALPVRPLPRLLECELRSG